MNNSVEGVPWLEKEAGSTVRATVIEGAEVVRTAAVSYATPILHQVYIEGGASLPQENTTVLSSSDYKPYRLNVSTPTSGMQINGLSYMNDCEAKCVKENSSLHLPSFLVSSDSSFSSSSSVHNSSSSSSSSSSPLWVFSPTLLSSNSMVLRPVTSSKSSNFSLNSSFSTSTTSTSFVSPSPITSLMVSSSSSSTSSSFPPLFSSSSTAKNDDELTSLTWLQDSNLLMGTALAPIKRYTPSNSDGPATEKKRGQRGSGRKDSSNIINTIKLEGENQVTLKSFDDGKHETQEEYKVDSPTSDYAEETTELSSADSSEVGETVLGRSSTPKPQAIPYNPKVHVKAKPPFSFSCLIFMAIEESPTKALPVKDIYSWILDHYPYYRNAPTGWKNSVRHNLSLNKCFSKVEKSQNLGKGSLWMVDPTFRPNLLQAMSKTPFTTQSKNDRTYLISNKAVINTKYLYGLTSKTSEKPISNGDFVVENEVDVFPSNKAVGPLSTPVESLGPLSNSDNKIVSSSDGNTKHGSEQSNEEVEIQNPCEENVKTKHTLYAPDPELYPRLARRLGSHKTNSFSVNFQSEDVDAAAAMLVLKHGPRMLSPFHDTFSNMRNLETLLDTVEGKAETRTHKNSESSDSGSVVISSSPSLDHAYVSKNKLSSQDYYIVRAKKETTSPTSSVDEAFFDDSFENESLSFAPSLPDDLRPYEEADALLNLASVATSLASREALLDSNKERLSSDLCNSLSENALLTCQSPKSQFSYLETQKSCNNEIHLQNGHANPKRRETNNQNTAKRKQDSSVKMPNAKKLATLNIPTNHLSNKNSHRLISQNKYLNSNYHNNNNNSRIINKNKVRVKKILKSDKSY